ncbi:hypothetical protein ACFQ9X_33965 [Catenulispora yoronensis]
MVGAAPAAVDRTEVGLPGPRWDEALCEPDAPPGSCWEVPDGDDGPGPAPAADGAELPVERPVEAPVDVPVEVPVEGESDGAGTAVPMLPEAGSLVSC